MRVLAIVKATNDSERGVLPTTEQFEAMGKFNEELAAAGIMLAGEGLHPSSQGKRVRFEGGRKSTVIDGPFAETKELIAGFWLWQVRSMDEAVEWLKRAPFEKGDVVEIRQIYAVEEFGDSFTPELQDRMKKINEVIQGNRT